MMAAGKILLLKCSPLVHAYIFRRGFLTWGKCVLMILQNVSQEIASDSPCTSVHMWYFHFVKQDATTNSRFAPRLIITKDSNGAVNLVIALLIKAIMFSRVQQQPCFDDFSGFQEQPWQILIGESSIASKNCTDSVATWARAPSKEKKWIVDRCWPAMFGGCWWPTSLHPSFVALLANPISASSQLGMAISCRRQCAV